MERNWSLYESFQHFTHNTLPGKHMLRTRHFDIHYIRDFMKPLPLVKKDTEQRNFICSLFFALHKHISSCEKLRKYLLL